jgi:hypothetical protein
MEAKVTIQLSKINKVDDGFSGISMKIWHLVQAWRVSDQYLKMILNLGRICRKNI